MGKENQVYNLVILGATPGGITTAIAAARHGFDALILERTPYIGGLPANGLGATDIATRGCGGGLFKEFVDRILKFYVDRYGQNSQQVVDCDHGYHFEPHAAELVFHEMIEAQSNHITILRNRQFDFEHENICFEQDKIKSIRVLNRQTQQLEVHQGEIFIDASYEGDLIAAARVPYFVGREGREVYDEPGAGRVFKLWRGEECAGTTNMGDNAIQAYNYRLCLTNKADNTSSFKQPPGYRREEYVSLIEDIKSGTHTCQVRPERLTDSQLYENQQCTRQGSKPKHHHLPGIVRLCSNVRLPNGKVDANNQHLAFISTDLPEENWPYPTSSWEWRDAFALRQRRYTEGLLYFAQNDEEVPKWFREELKPWGWAADEYCDNGHFPRQLYVREGRRMKGKYVFTAHDSLPGADGKAPLHKDSVTASHYPLDSHAARKRETNRVHLDGFISYPNMPYTVPYGVMVPDAAVRNLLAPVPCSASHIGFSTLRMEPCWMALGHAAGLAACLSIQHGVPVAEVEVAQLQDLLLEEGAVLCYDQSDQDPKSVNDWKGAQQKLLCL